MAPPSPVPLSGNPNAAFYGNSLKNLLSNPGSFQADPGYQFSVNQALQGVGRANSKMLGSGNIMTALADRAGGMASQAYDTRVNQLSGILGEQDQFGLGTDRNAIDAQNSANQFQLGSDQNANVAQRNANDLALGKGQLDLGYFNDTNNYNLGAGQNANTAQRNANDYALGAGANANNAQRNLYDYTLGQGQNANQMYSAQTQRGAAQSSAYNNASANNLDWTKFYYQLYPRQRVAGQP